MNKIYILYKLELRAETTDTLIYYASFDKVILEEIILSIWEEAKEINENEKVLNNFISQFNIIEIPLI